MEYETRGSILPNYFRNEDGTFKKEEAMVLSGKIAGICYDKEGFEHIDKEPLEKTMKRVTDTLNNGHHSVYDHIFITFNFTNIPKILAMVLNNENEYTTSEKSARYTRVTSCDGILTDNEVELYNKWFEIFKEIIKDRYGNVYNDFKIRTLSQENARYLVSVFMPTTMSYTTSFRQINYIASWLEKYIKSADMEDVFEFRLSSSMRELLNVLKELNVLEEGLMTNEKERGISLFGSNLDKRKEVFDWCYSTTYLGSFASLAQAQRHRTLDYTMEFLKDKEFFVPPIINDNDALVSSWLDDMNVVKDNYPQGELVRINERGTIENFILKCKERLCSAPQLEIMLQTKEIIEKYKNAVWDDNLLYDYILPYTKGARCTFSDYTCPKDCKFNEGKILVRKI